jgi:hypothetical protein
MTFEEFEKAAAPQLKAEANACFDGATTGNGSWERRLAKLQEAQFYMSEMDRRESGRVADRDFLMEKWVIGLIALELIFAAWGIWLSAKESKEQAQVMERVVIVLERVEKAAIRSGNMNLLRH